MNIPSISRFSFQRSFSIRKSILFWYRSYRWIFTLLFLIVLGLGGWKWYQSLYRYSWTDAQKKEFLASYISETDFRESRFRQAVKELDDRRKRNEHIPDIQHDIFQLDKILDKDRH